ncbi:MAG: hypothetical protein PVI88_01895 [Nitrosopumilaceae archaeon]|jgi:hypothetical protein
MNRDFEERLKIYSEMIQVAMRKKPTGKRNFSENIGIKKEYKNEMY